LVVVTFRKLLHMVLTMSPKYEVLQVWAHLVWRVKDVILLSKSSSGLATIMLRFVVDQHKVRASKGIKSSQYRQGSRIILQFFLFIWWYLSFDYSFDIHKSTSAYLIPSEYAYASFRQSTTDRPSREEMVVPWVLYTWTSSTKTAIRNHIVSKCYEKPKCP